MKVHRTLVIIKPDAVRRGLIGEIIKLYEIKGLKISDIKMLESPELLLEEHYSEHLGKPYYESLIRFMKSGPMIVMIIQGENAIELVRKINGATNHLDADYGTIRGLYANSITENCVHGSDSLDNAEKECKLWFE